MVSCGGAWHDLILPSAARAREMAKKKKASPLGDSDTAPQATPPQPTAAKPPPDPKWIWPPFPTPPDGVKIIPFSEFEPKGIKMSFGDEPERDGEGLETIPLLVKHGLSGNRKGRGKKKNNPLAELSEEELRKMTWDKRWELGEELRTARTLDHYEPLVERFIQSTRLFHDCRPWDRPRQELWDQFRLYTGIISGLKKPQGKKKSQYVDDDEADGHQSPDENLSDEDVMTVDPEAIVSDEEPIVSSRDKEEEARFARNEERYQQLVAAREERPHFWVQEPEKATKIFLSSHFRDKGLMWSEPSARDMPIILRLYFEFVLRNKLFVEKDFNRGYEKALAISKRAELDLLATFKISRAFPDEWGEACKSFWGQLYYTPFEEHFRKQMHEQSEPKEKAQSDQVNDSESFEEANHPKLVTVEYDLGEKKITEDAPQVVPVVVPIPEEATIEEVDESGPTAKMVAAAMPPTSVETSMKDEGTTQAGDDDGGWGPSSDKVSTADLVNEWDLPKDNLEEEDVWGTYVEPTLFAFLGPSEFPVRRIPIRVEKSIRVLVAILPPEPSSSSITSSRLATLVLQPWPTPDDDPDSLVTSLQMVDYWKDDPAKRELSNQSVKVARSFNPTKDEIRVHVDPTVVTECRLGMGIGAIWVQIGRRADLEDSAAKSAKRKKNVGDEWWYMERLEFVIPSYWTANEARLDMTRSTNNPEYAYDVDSN